MAGVSKCSRACTGHRTAGELGAVHVRSGRSRVTNGHRQHCARTVTVWSGASLVAKWVRVRGSGPGGAQPATAARGDGEQSRIQTRANAGSARRC